MLIMGKNMTFIHFKWLSSSIILEKYNNQIEKKNQKSRF